MSVLPRASLPGDDRDGRRRSPRPVPVRRPQRRAARASSSPPATRFAFDEGTELFHEGDPADFWWVLLDGRVELVRRAGREEAVVMMTMDRPGVWAGGFHAWDDESSYLATGRGASSGRDVPGAVARRSASSRGPWFPFGVHLIEGFFQTVRSMDSLSRQREALIALGTFAAGLAPRDQQPGRRPPPAPSTRCRTRCDTLLSSLVQLAERSLLGRAVRRPRRAPPRDRARRRDRRRPAGDRRSRGDADRLARRARRRQRAGASHRRSPRPASTSPGASAPPRCSTAARSNPGSTGSPAPSPPGRCSSEMKDSTGAHLGARRRREVVLAARPRVAAAHRRHRGHREHARDARRTSCATASPSCATTAPTCPQIEANPGELNQVWTNLIDNAIDAMDGNGTLRISTRASTATISSSRSATPGPGCRPRCRPAPSSRSSRPRTSARAPVSASTSRAASSSTATTARSRSRRSRTRPCCACASPWSAPDGGDVTVAARARWVARGASDDLYNYVTSLLYTDGHGCRGERIACPSEPLARARPRWRRGGDH